jgi:hypothetical protein
VLAADPDNGKCLTELRCSPCHIVMPHQREEVADSPPLETIARKFGFNADMLALSMRDPHPRMNITVTGREAEDLAACAVTRGKWLPATLSSTLRNRPVIQMPASGCRRRTADALAAVPILLPPHQHIEHMRRQHHAPVHAGQFSCVSMPVLLGEETGSIRGGSRVAQADPARFPYAAAGLRSADGRALACSASTASRVFSNASCSGANCS